MPDITVPGSRKASPVCEAFIKSYEKCRLNAYMPTPRDRPTIGWGSTGPDVRMGMHWTQAQCDERFARDLDDFCKGVDHLLGNAQTSQCQFDALVSFAYNVGLDDDADTLAEGLGDSTLLRLHKNRLWIPASEQFAKWDHQGGTVLAGLTRRRAAEAQIYRGVYV